MTPARERFHAVDQRLQSFIADMRSLMRNDRSGAMTDRIRALVPMMSVTLDIMREIHSEGLNEQRLAFLQACADSLERQNTSGNEHITSIWRLTHATDKRFTH